MGEETMIHKMIFKLEEWESDPSMPQSREINKINYSFSLSLNLRIQAAI